MTYEQAKQIYANSKPEQCLPLYRNVLLAQYEVMQKIRDTFNIASKLLVQINCSRNYFSTEIVDETKTIEYDAFASDSSTIDYINGRSYFQVSEKVYIKRTLHYDHLKGIVSLNDYFFIKMIQRLERIQKLVY